MHLLLTPLGTRLYTLKFFTLLATLLLDFKELAARNDPNKR